MLAVIKIALGGFEWMTASDNATTRSKARVSITGALFGLGILLATTVVLYTINPDIVKLNIFQDAPTVGVDTTTPPTKSSTLSGSDCEDHGWRLTYPGDPESDQAAYSTWIANNAKKCGEEGGSYELEDKRTLVCKKLTCTNR